MLGKRLLIDTPAAGTWNLYLRAVRLVFPGNLVGIFERSAYLGLYRVVWGTGIPTTADDTLEGYKRRFHAFQSILEGRPLTSSIRSFSMEATAYFLNTC